MDIWYIMLIINGYCFNTKRFTEVSSMTAIHETKQHGRKDFQYTVYGGKLPEWMSGFPLHWHDEMELICMVKGSMIVGIQSEEQVISEGDIALVQPQFVHCIKQDGDKSAFYFNVLFRLSILDSGDLCTEKYLNPLFSGEVIVPKYLKKGETLTIALTPYVKRLAEIERDKIENQELFIKSCLLAILHFLSPLVKPESVEDQKTRMLYDKLKRALDHLHNNYQEEITVEKAAALCNFSASHFSKMFRQLTGVSFNRFLINYRLEKAAKKLIESNAGISETAFACGFNNFSYFTRAFKEKYGMTPNEFKKSGSPSHRNSG